MHISNTVTQYHPAFTAQFARYLMVPVILLIVTPLLVVGSDFSPLCGVLGLAALSYGSLATLVIIVQGPTTWVFLSIHTCLA